MWKTSQWQQEDVFTFTYIYTNSQNHPEWKRIKLKSERKGETKKIENSHHSCIQAPTHNQTLILIKLNFYFWKFLIDCVKRARSFISFEDDDEDGGSGVVLVEWYYIYAFQYIHFIFRAFEQHLFIACLFLSLAPIPFLLLWFHFDAMELFQLEERAAEFLKLIDFIVIYKWLAVSV